MMMSYLLKETTCSESGMLVLGQGEKNENNHNNFNRCTLHWNLIFRKCLTADPSAPRLVCHRV